MELLIHETIHTLKHTSTLFPFLFLTYLAMEYLEHKAGKKTIAMLLGAGRKGPVVGGLLGAVPQCGFSAAAASLYSGGVITVGTLLAVFLSTSDEMLPILISQRVDVKTILLILGAKAVAGVIAGILVDIAVKTLHKGEKRTFHIHEMCERDHCHCEKENIFISALIHSVQIIVFIFLVTLVVNYTIGKVGMENVVLAVSSNPYLGIFLTALVGLIPNCAASVAITTLYLEGVLTVGCMFAGLLSCAGIGLLVLFRTNSNWKKNLQITGMLYGISVVFGIIAEILF